MRIHTNYLPLCLVFYSFIVQHFPINCIFNPPEIMDKMEYLWSNILFYCKILFQNSLNMVRELYSLSVPGKKRFESAHKKKEKLILEFILY